LVKLRILVTGAGGLLGSAVVSIASHKHEIYAAFSQHQPAEGIRVRLNLHDKGKIGATVKEIMPDAVVHAAALTDVDRCEKEEDLAIQINHEATASLAESAKSVGAYFLYVGTDYVFDGLKGMYGEEDPPNPINVYGRTKLLGEKSVLLSGVESCIARASVIYGAQPAAGKVNFAMWLLECLRNGTSVKIIQDQYSSPTLNTSCAQMILEATERRAHGTFHLAGASRVSRFEFAMALAETFGLDNSLIVPVRMENMQWSARRPRDSSLDVSKASTFFGAKPLPLDAALRRFSREVASSSA
jgi:dTDP-4-dehydrorhamnose reductase